MEQGTATMGDTPVLKSIGESVNEMRAVLNELNDRIISHIQPQAHGSVRDLTPHLENASSRLAFISEKLQAQLPLLDIQQGEWAHIIDSITEDSSQRIPMLQAILKMHRDDCASMISALHRLRQTASRLAVTDRELSGGARRMSESLTLIQDVLVSVTTHFDKGLQKLERVTPTV